MSLPRIAVTTGDPAGIGPEVCLKLLANPEVLEICQPIIFGDASVLYKAAVECGLPRPEKVVHRLEAYADGLTFVEIQRGECFEDDIERIEDDFGRSI